MEPKPGVKTSEFGLSLLAIVVGAVLASGMLPDTHWLTQALGAASAALAALGYSAARAKVKSGGG